MLPAINRLKKKRDFDRVFKKGKGFKEDFLVLKSTPNNLKISRFGFIVSQKVSKKATVRNKIKRKLRELVRLRMAEIKKGIDGVLIVSKGLENEKLEQLEKKFVGLFKKAKLIS